MHLQYYFFAIKEYCLVIYDEIVNRSISTSVEAKIQQAASKKNEAEAQETQALLAAEPD